MIRKLLCSLDLHTGLNPDCDRCTVIFFNKDLRIPRICLIEEMNRLKMDIQLLNAKLEAANAESDKLAEALNPLLPFMRAYITANGGPRHILEVIEGAIGAHNERKNEK